MTEPRVVELIGKRIAITDTMRAGVVAELPEIEWISDPALRQNVTDAWAAALAASPFSRISEMKPSGNYDTRPLRHGTQADHFRSVTRMAVKIAEEMAALFPDFRYDRDLLIGGCLCHDIGKVWEFDPENVRRWNADPRANGRPSIRHPAFGLYICLAMGLPGGDRPLRRGSFGRGRVGAAQPREHHPAPGRLHVLARGRRWRAASGERSLAGRRTRGSKRGQNMTPRGRLRPLLMFT